MASIQMPLKADKHFANVLDRPQLGDCIGDGVVLEFDQVRQLVGIEFADAALHVMVEHEARNSRWR